MIAPDSPVAAPKTFVCRMTTVAILIGLALNVRAADPAAITIDDIAVAVDSARSRVEDLSVDFTFDAVRLNPDNLFYRSQMSVQIKGGKVAYRHIYGSAPGANGDLFVRHVAFNGKQTTTYDRRAGTAVVAAGPTPETSLKGMGFFDLMLWNRPEGTEGAGDMDLATMLRSRQASLRPRTQAVRGTPCRVVDVKWPGSDKTMVTLWLDPARGFLPLRHVWFTGPDPDKADMEFDIEDADEVPPGVWCATAGRKVLHPDGKFLKQKCEWRMVVARKPDGRPKIRVNDGIDDQAFEPWRTLPPGQFLVDARTGRGAAAGSPDYDALAKELDLTLASADPPIVERAGGPAKTAAPPPLGSAPSPADGRSAWFSTGIALAAVVLGVLAFQLWRRATRV